MQRVALLVVLFGAVVTACTTSFNPGERPRRDAGNLSMDVFAMDVSTDAGGKPDVVDDAFSLDAPSTDGKSTDGFSEGGCGDCGPGRTCCNGTCVDLLISPMHCGACGNACPGTSCSGGTCTSTCLLGFADCDRNGANGCEVDVRTNPMHCGACGVACPDGRPCEGGRCACPSGFADCDGNPGNGCEANIASDPMRCGSCTHACGANQVCDSGMCRCADGFADCDSNPSNGCEVDLRTSANHCGGCGRNCGSNATCVGGMCRCIDGFLRCPADAPGCTTPANDPMNCTACGMVCSGTTPVCTPTGCASGCTSGQTRCGASCVDTTTDVRHCGRCDNACAMPANATAACTMGTCSFRCNPGWGDCDGNAANGCEADLNTSRDHCGACGNRCPGDQTCVSGRCVCPAGLRDCGGGACAQCCNDTQCADSDPCTQDRCTMGMCQHTGCDARGLRCCGSACRACCTDTDCSGIPGRGCGPDGTCSVCLAGFADCDGNAANGCEVDTRTSVMHCGACGNACSFPNASATCVNGVCTLGTCNPGFANCDGNPANGCEVNINTSLEHCGGCGMRCSIPGANAVCNMGRCERSSCASGRGDCDGDPSNGCETDLTASVMHCGACGNACRFTNASAMCVSGSCVLGSCNSGYGNCDGNSANGCETDVRTSVSHCGMCGRACMLPRATAACSGGSCTVAACEAGWGDCNGTASDGCETDVRSDVANCGTCGTICPTPPNAVPTCTTGRCGFTCMSGYADCDGDPTNGCEVNLSTSVDNCGACGNRCSFPNASAMCVSGMCTLGTCRSGFANCDGVDSNGCEVDIRTDVNNCSACGNRCVLPNATATCMDGRCRVGTCAAGYNNCDGADSNGCELNCGAGRMCAGGQCAAGWIGMNISPLSGRRHMFFAVAPERHELLVWGGTDGTRYFSDGARYNWDTNTWTTMAPPPMGLAARAYGMGVWTGNKFFVWGGSNSSGELGDGALYDPQSNAWTMVSSSNAPGRRAGFVAFWDGSRIVLYGGVDGTTILSDGAVYDPRSDNWSRPGNLTNGDGNTARLAAAWTGTSILLYGGEEQVLCTPPRSRPSDWLRRYRASSGWSGGANYRPARWFAPADGCAPTPWIAPWTGTEMFVWGGYGCSATCWTQAPVSSGGLYNPATDAWRRVASAPSALSSGGYVPVIVWTGAPRNRVVGWSLASLEGLPPSPTVSEVVFTYDPGADVWAIVSPPGTAPPPVSEGAAYGWTGQELIVWGGRTSSGVTAQGGRLVP